MALFSIDESARNIRANKPTARGGAAAWMADFVSLVVGRDGDENFLGSNCPGV